MQRVTEEAAQGSLVVRVVRDSVIRGAQKTHAPLTTTVKGVITNTCALREIGIRGEGEGQRAIAGGLVIFGFNE